MNDRMDGALTKWAVGIFTEGKSDGPVTKYAAKIILHSDGITKIISLYVL